MNNNLAYEISLPDDFAEGKKYPVIYAMHGMGSNEKDIMSVVEELKNDFIIIGMRGPLVMNSGFAYFTIKSIGNPDVDSFDKAIENIEDVIARYPDQYPIDPSRQFLLGFSQGAILAMTLALKMGNKIKGIVALSGYIPRHVKETYSIKPVHELSVFIGHGKYDQVFPAHIGNENYDFFQERNESLIFNSYPIDHQISLEEKNDVILWLQLNK